MDNLICYLKKFTHQGGIIISPRAKMLYMKAARTGGTSILRGAFKNLLVDVIHYKDNKKEFFNWLNNIKDGDLTNYYKFTVSRNPYDRFISASFYLKTPINKLIDNLEEGKLSEDHKIHCMPQYIYSHNDDKLFVNRILRFENLQEDFNLLCKELKLKECILPHKKKTDHKHYLEYYNVSLQERVYNYYKFDFELLGYSKDVTKIEIK
jgi:hypothetical protein